MQQVAANAQLRMLIQRMSSQLVIETGRDIQHGQDALHGDGRSSFRGQRVFRAKRGESFKKARPNHSIKSRDTSTSLKRRNADERMMKVVTVVDIVVVIQVIREGR